MRILLVGAGGTLGGAVNRALVERGHEVIGVGRSGGDLVCDVTDPEAVARMYGQAGPLDAVAVAAGDAVFRPLAELSADDFAATFRGKALSQLELVRQGARHVAETGSFTLVSGILTEEPIVAGSAASAANGAVEAFVRAAAIELPPRRINAVSPTVAEESLPAYGPFFAGMEPVPASRVATAYVRSIEGAQTGQVYRVR
ncbi:short chain dehydrogenase [Streptomyces triculaminicus]|uniref:Short chain dehydrogenase n=2 Tax=Streptomyces TaxID=1883 RepID=A0A939JRG5_9ACTN|nr:MULTISPECIES: short chain dehydrogenase [Streptomyces]MBO0654300.1 short chain dehydrogenase [Streptomyces triculaminicus]QSY48939.1 short chain dehydrogenase [Streptomyces griseocarneus]